MTVISGGTTMKNGKFRNFFIPDTKIYLWIIAILIGIIFFYNIEIAIVGSLLLVYLIYYNWKIIDEKKIEFTEYVENLSMDIDVATQQILLDLPFPLAILEGNGTIMWYNSKFADISNQSEILGKKIKDLYSDIDIKRILEKKQEKNIFIQTEDGRSYEVLSKVVESSLSKHDNRPIIMLYWVDKTQYQQMKERYYQEKEIISIIQVDNYDEVMQSVSENNRSLVTAAIDRKINMWAKEIDALIKKFSDDKYILVFQKKYMSNLEEKRFDILDIVRDIQSGNKIPITLSIGVGIGEDDTPIESYESANAALDIALGRGGDQAVVKKGEKLFFYGGKSQAVEKRTKVKARVIAHALKQFIEQADQIFIMGHKSPDLDSLGSALGIYRACKTLEREAFIILKQSNPNIEILHRRLIKEGYQEVLIEPEKARKMITENTLLVICDTHRPSFTEEPELIDMIDRVVLIDHHRRGSEFIEDPILTYLEPYASSTNELVTEILQYITEKIELEPVEADAMLAGIFIDTKNFTFKTGVRTFEAASFLRRKGANTVSAKLLFQSDMSTFLKKAETVKKAEIYRDHIAISISPSDEKDATLIAAQAADELLNIHGIVCSFVLTHYQNQVFISGRSLGDISVQLILEKLGGGGHLSVAGAQLLDVSFDQAIVMLKKAIDEYLEEGEKK